jgi:predicted RNase H-like nuclease
MFAFKLEHNKDGTPADPPVLHEHAIFDREAAPVVLRVEQEDAARADDDVVDVAVAALDVVTDVPAFTPVPPHPPSLDEGGATSSVRFPEPYAVSLRSV